MTDHWDRVIKAQESSKREEEEYLRNVTFNAARLLVAAVQDYVNEPTHNIHKYNVMVEANRVLDDLLNKIEGERKWIRS